MGAGAEEDVEEQIEIIRQSMEKEPDALPLSLREIILKFRMFCRKLWMRESR